jgi:hypothetical protein
VKTPIILMIFEESTSTPTNPKKKQLDCVRYDQVLKKGVVVVVVG